MTMQNMVKYAQKKFAQDRCDDDEGKLHSTTKTSRYSSEFPLSISTRTFPFPLSAKTKIGLIVT